MACDAGIRFTAEDVYLIEFSVSSEVLQMAKDTIDVRAARRKQKKPIKKLSGQEQQRQCSLIR